MPLLVTGQQLARLLRSQQGGQQDGREADLIKLYVGAQYGTQPAVKKMLLHTPPPRGDVATVALW